MAKSVIQFDQWLPDQPGIAGALQEAYNVVPQSVGYGTLPSAVDLSQAADTNLNNVFVSKYAATSTVFAGSFTKLYKFDSADLSLDNVSKSGNYTSTNRWNFAQFGPSVIAANGVAKLQRWDLGSSTAFADLAAAAPTARFVAAVRDFVVAGNVAGEESKVYWSDINDETDWTPSASSQSDSQTLPDGGDIRGITGGEFGLVLLERSVVRMSYVGAPLFFQFDTIAKNIGCYEPNSVIQYGNLTFFLSDDGFYSCDGQVLNPIGAEKINRHFFTYVDQSKLEEMSAAIDVIRKLVIWQFTDIFAKKRFIIYNFVNNKWSEGETTTDYLGTAATAGTTLEGLDTFGTMDSIQTSFDSRLWAGGRFVLAGVRGNKIVTLTGQPQSGYITTNDIGDGSQSMITLVKPKVDTGSASVSIASRNLLDEVPNFPTETAADAENRIGFRNSGNYHRLKVYPTGANWKNAVGVEIEIVKTSGR
jgi:hypothetical protein